MKKSFFYLISLFVMGSVVVSCGDDNNSPTINTDDNGTGIQNNGGDGNTKLAPEAEKKHIEETARLFESYFVASETEEVTSTAKELDNVANGDLDELNKAMFVETVASKATTYTYDYYDVVIDASKAKGVYEAKANGTWKKTSDSDKLIMKYTDSHDAIWQLTLTTSGNKGRVYVDKNRKYTYSYNYNGQEYDYESKTTQRKYYVDVPAETKVVLTRQGVEKVNCVVSISELATGDDYRPTPLSKAKGNVVITLTPQDKTYVVNADFCYMPNSRCWANTTVKKGNAILVNERCEGTSVAPSSSEKELNGTNLKCTVDILGRLQVHMTSDDFRKVSDAYENARKSANITNEDYVRDCSAIINEHLNAKITNNGGNAEQAQAKTMVKSKNYYSSTRYSINAVLNFSDGTSYGFEEYFSKAYFNDVINKFNDFISKIKAQTK